MKTVKWFEMELTAQVDYDFQPHEPATRTDPTVHAEVTINSILVSFAGKDIEVTDWIDKTIKLEMEQEILDEHLTAIAEAEAIASDAAYDLLRDERL